MSAIITLHVKIYLSLRCAIYKTQPNWTLLNSAFFQFRLQNGISRSRPHCFIALRKADTGFNNPLPRIICDDTVLDFAIGNLADHTPFGNGLATTFCLFPQRLDMLSRKCKANGNYISHLI